MIKDIKPSLLKVLTEDIQDPSKSMIMGPLRIKKIRRKYGLTQPKFADYIGISFNTYRNWEIGHRNPSGPAIALLYIAETQPKTFELNRKMLIQELKALNLFTS